MTVLDSAAVALPSNPSIDDLFSRNSNTDLESTLDPAWVQRVLLLLRKEQLLLSTSGTCPTVTVGVGSVV